MSNPNRKVDNPYKDIEFEEFIKLIKGNTVAHWVDVAKALGISKDTITEWKLSPRAQQAIREGIAEALDGMKKAGSKDWRMWESKLKMLGVSPVDKLEVDANVTEIPILGGTSVHNKENEKEEEVT